MTQFDKDQWDEYLRLGRKGRPRLTVFKKSDGRCFYCGMPLRFRGEKSARNWLMVKAHNSAILEHKRPICRGGDGKIANLVPACSTCNSEKGSFTADEFRFVRGLRAGSLGRRFHSDPPPPVERDWMCCNTQASERSLLIHNFPDAAIAYGLRNGWRRSWAGQRLRASIAAP